MWTKLCKPTRVYAFISRALPHGWSEPTVENGARIQMSLWMPLLLKKLCRCTRAMATGHCPARRPGASWGLGHPGAPGADLASIRCPPPGNQWRCAWHQTENEIHSGLAAGTLSCRHRGRLWRRFAEKAGAFCMLLLLYWWSFCCPAYLWGCKTAAQAVGWIQ